MPKKIYKFNTKKKFTGVRQTLGKQKVSVIKNLKKNNQVEVKVLVLNLLLLVL